MLLARCFNSVNIRKYIYIQNTIIAYISNLLQTCYTVLVNILVLVIIQSPFHLSVNTTHTTHYTLLDIEVRSLRHTEIVKDLPPKDLFVNL